MPSDFQISKVGSNHVTKRISKQVRVLAAVRTERHFLQVCGKTLRAGLVPRSQTAAFQVYSKHEGVLAVSRSLKRGPIDPACTGAPARPVLA